MELHTKFKKVVYIDIDIHHCDGVEDAFAFSNKVLRISFHLKEVGFFPGTGSPTYTGKSKSQITSLNIPLQRGLKRQNLSKRFREVVGPALRTYNPDAIVMQCGADGLWGDALMMKEGEKGAVMSEFDALWSESGVKFRVEVGDAREEDLETRLGAKRKRRERVEEPALKRPRTDVTDGNPPDQKTLQATPPASPSEDSKTEPPQGWNLDVASIAQCLRIVLDEFVPELLAERKTASETDSKATEPNRIPVLVLGGGGYTSTLVARAWCLATMVALGGCRGWWDDEKSESDEKGDEENGDLDEIEVEIPEHALLPMYKPDFLLWRWKRHGGREEDFGTGPVRDLNEI
ncbi:Histone deacetylase 8 [Phlyctochytrium planicorne]|nr:Histone deacetylase 8 [Phlyctochytrium planicorne]